MEPLQLVLGPLRTDDEFALYRGEHSNQPVSPSVLLLARASTRPALETLKKIKLECSLRDELNSTWAIRSQAVFAQRGQTALVLEDLGREILNRFLPCPMEMKKYVGFAVSVATALSGLHKK